MIIRKIIPLALIIFFSALAYAGGGGGGGEIVGSYYPNGVGSIGLINASLGNESISGGSYLPLLDNALNKKFTIIDCFNSTDVDLFISSNGTVDLFGVGPHQAHILYLREKYINTNLHVRNIEGFPPTLGAITCSGIY